LQKNAKNRVRKICIFSEIFRNFYPTKIRKFPEISENPGNRGKSRFCLGKWPKIGKNPDFPEFSGKIAKNLLFDGQKMAKNPHFSGIFLHPPKKSEKSDFFAKFAFSEEKHRFCDFWGVPKFPKNGPKFGPKFQSVTVFLRKFSRKKKIVKNRPRNPPILALGPKWYYIDPL
jgi:hypothetical protein